MIRILLILCFVVSSMAFAQDKPLVGFEVEGYLKSSDYFKESNSSTMMKKTAESLHKTLSEKYENTVLRQNNSKLWEVEVTNNDGKSLKFEVTQDMSVVTPYEVANPNVVDAGLEVRSIGGQRYDGFTKDVYSLISDPSSEFSKSFTTDNKIDMGFKKTSTESGLHLWRGIYEKGVQDFNLDHLDQTDSFVKQTEKLTTFLESYQKNYNSIVDGTINDPKRGQFPFNKTLKSKDLERIGEVVVRLKELSTQFNKIIPETPLKKYTRKQIALEMKDIVSNLAEKPKEGLNSSSRLSLSKSKVLNLGGLVDKGAVEMRNFDSQEFVRLIEHLDKIDNLIEGKSLPSVKKHFSNSELKIIDPAGKKSLPKEKIMCDPELRGVKPGLHAINPILEVLDVVMTAKNMTASSFDERFITCESARLRMGNLYCKRQYWANESLPLTTVFNDRKYYLCEMYVNSYLSPISVTPKGEDEKVKACPIRGLHFIVSLDKENELNYIDKESLLVLKSGYEFLVDSEKFHNDVNRVIGEIEEFFKEYKSLKIETEWKKTHDMPSRKTIIELLERDAKESSLRS